MIQTSTNIRVRYAETDKMGFAHHQNYVAYFEEARVDFLDKIGVPYAQLEANDCFMPVLEIHIQYIKSNTFDDVLTVNCFLDELPKAKFKIRYEVYRDGELTTKGNSLHCFMNQQGRAIRPDKRLMDIIVERFKNPS